VRAGSPDYGFGETHTISTAQPDGMDDEDVDRVAAGRSDAVRAQKVERHAVEARSGMPQPLGQSSRQ
jgi:hypothetical protein